MKEKNEVLSEKIEAKEIKGTKFVDEFSKEVYEQTYRYGNEDIDGTQLRSAVDLAKEEKNKKFWENQFLWALEDFKFVPGGRITSNAGTGLKGTTYINCFTPDTNVLTKYGYRSISDIKIGDEVLTHTGNFKPVISVMKKQYDGKLDVYKSSNLTEEIKSTPEHPFYQGNNVWVESDFNEKLVLFKSNNTNSNVIIVDLYEITKWIKRNGIESNNIFKDDEYVYTITETLVGNGAVQTRSTKKVKRFVTIDENFAYAIGRFIGDGSTFSVGGVYEVDGFNIVFNNKEIDSMLEIKATLENAFGLEININKSNDFDASYLRKNSPIISHFLLESCGRYSINKKIPNFIWESSKEVKIKFLLGLFDADGTITANTAKFTINNECLANDLQALFLEVGIPTTKLKSFVKSYPDNVYHTITLVGKFAREFIKKSEKVYADGRISEFTSKKEAKIESGHFISSVKEEQNEFDGNIFVVNKFEKSEINYNGLVFNISVLDDESYVVNNIIVHNCFVDGFMGEDRDSMEGILSALRRQALILKSEGGYGFCVDTMRPRGGFIDGIGNESPGSVRMLDMWDTQSAVITEGSGRKAKSDKAKGKIRKGAQMCTMSCFHPDIEEFITAKQTPGRLTKFNMSVLITDEFMDAVQKNSSFNLEFPDFDFNKEVYNKEWDGNLKSWKEKGYPVIIYKTYKNANELWDLIMKSTYNRNEPGVLFVDTINKLNNLYYNEYISATNPSLRAGTKVLTKNGIFNIEELQDTEFYVRNLNGEWSFAKCFLSGKKKPLYEIKTGNMKSHYATKEHKWPVLMSGGGFAKTTTDNLRKDNLIPKNPFRKVLEFDGDKSLTKEQGFMFGWMYGDGWIVDRKDKNITNYGMIFNENEKYIGELVVDTINKTNRKKINLTQKKSENNYYTQVGSQEFNTYIKSYGISSKEYLPTCIWQSNDDFIKGFIDGLFSADGYVSCDKEKHGLSIQLTSKYESVVKEVSELLSFYGIRSSYRKSVSKNIKFPNKKEYNKEYVRYDLCINYNNAIDFASIFSLTNKEKNEKLKNLLKNGYTRKNDEGLLRIKSVELTDIKEDVWDISVFDDTHCFEINHCITGNCGEQVLPTGGVCLLGSLNLTQFVDFEKRDWDYKKIKEIIPIAVRFMDNVNDITSVPLESQKENLKNKRRIGLGIMGYGSALMMLNTRYGSEYALKITETLMDFIANETYKSSALLAKEKGAFPLFDKDKFLAGNFVKILSKETIDLIKLYGIRNSHLLSIQPTGNSSIFANVVSGGLEPVFMPKYVRTSMMPYAPEGLDIPKNIDWDNKKFDSSSNWTWMKEGDENLLKLEFGDYNWKYDKSRGLLRETVVKDYAVRFLEEKNAWNEKADWAATTVQLGVDEHSKTMEVMSKYIDSAMSKTVNIPNDYPFEDFKKFYMDLFKTGTVKGGTTYRAGTMTEVLGAIKKDEEKPSNKIQKTNAPQRPKTLNCDIYQVATEGKKWIVLVGLLEKDPYEVFAFKSKAIHLPLSIKSGKLTKVKRGRYDLECDGGLVVESLVDHFETDEQEALTRLISTSLRHGVDIKFVVEQVSKSEGNITSFSKAIARTLKKYIPDGAKSTDSTCPNCSGKNTLVYQEGCVVCVNCSSSKC